MALNLLAQLGLGLARVPTLSVEAVDETGAGDVFLAALAVRRCDGADWRSAVRFANAASALSVADRGLLLPDRAAVEQAVTHVGAPVVDEPVQVPAP